MKYLIIILSLFIMGCAGNIKNHLKTIPDIAFQEIEYKRMGTFSSAIIEAYGARVVGDTLYINKVKVIENTPWGSIDFQMEGYSRKIKD